MTGPFARYLAVGAANTLLCLGVILALRLTLGVPDLMANLMGYLLGLGMSFLFNRRWTFRSDRRGAAGLARFLVVVVVAWMVNMTCVWAVLKTGVAPGIAHALGVPVYTLLSYVGCRRWVFKARTLTR